jgi:hypothetical protein
LVADQLKLFSLLVVLRQTTLPSRELPGINEVKILAEFELLQVAPNTMQY